MLRLLMNMFIVYPILCLLLITNSSGESESTHSDLKDDTFDDRKRSSLSDYWKNHRHYVNYVYAKNREANREAKSNAEPYFTEPNNNEQYDAVPSTIQITAIPGGGLGAGLGAGGFPGAGGGLFPTGGFGGGFGGFEGLGGNGWPQQQQKFPVFVINKSKSDHSKWLIPLLLLLGAPLLCGLILIPIALQTAFFLFTIFRNLGIILPLITGIAGNGIIPANPLIPTTG